MEPRPKVMIIIIIILAHECLWHTVWGASVKERGKGKDCKR
jgi:hypothetical protein